MGPREKENKREKEKEEEKRDSESSICHGRSVYLDTKDVTEAK